MVQQNLNPDAAREVKKIQDRLRKLETGNRIGDTSIDSGALLIKSSTGVVLARLGDLSAQAGMGGFTPHTGLALYGDGMFVVYDPENSFGMIYLGALTASYNRLDGSAQTGFLLFRDDGAIAMAMADLNPAAGGYHQAIQIYDRSANVIFADDTNGGVGHARPWLHQGAWTSLNFPTDTTTSASFTTLQQSIVLLQQPMWGCQVLIRASDGTTTGEVRVVDANSNQIGSTFTVTAGAYTYAQFGPAPLTGNYGASLTLQIQARRTAGAGTIGVQGMYSIGSQS